MKFSTSILAIFACLGLSFASSAQIGNPAPNFTVTDTHGNTHTLYNYLDSGKVVVLDFFYTTCGPCQFYSPQVNLAYEKYGCNDANVIFMSVDYGDTDAQVLAYDNTYNIHYPSISGVNGGGNAVVNQYQIIGFPTFYVIDSSRTIIEKIDPPTLQVFDYRFNQHGIQPAACLTGAVSANGTQTGLKLYPNPAAAGGSLQFVLPTVAADICQYQIMDFTGRIVQNGQVISDATQQAELKLRILPTGTYLLKVTPANGKGTYSGKFFIE